MFSFWSLCSTEEKLIGQLHNYVCLKIRNLALFFIIIFYLLEYCNLSEYIQQ
jgi:hypothetical protein